MALYLGAMIVGAGVALIVERLVNHRRRNPDF